jgi:hypothetical protein
MRPDILIKLFAVGMLAVLLLVPLLMIQARSAKGRYRATVVATSRAGNAQAPTVRCWSFPTVPDNGGGQ